MGNTLSSLRSRILALAAMLALASASAVAQSTYGNIIGVVTDPSSAIVRDAVIQAINENTGISRSVKTDTAGFFRFLNMDPGTYTITGDAQGFAKLERKNVSLLAREEIRLDLPLALASTGTQTVEVTATPVVAEQLTISDSKSGDVINSLALNFRATANPSPIVVANLAPGVNTDSGGNITFSGQLPNATSFSLDGISTQLPRYGGPTKDLFPSVEGILEFRVNTAANSAEFAQPTDLTVTTKSGANQFHGSGYWFLQRQDFNSADQISGVVPTDDANTFGATFSGPVWLENLYKGKDRTFFFFDYEGVRLDQNTFIQTFTPPTQWRTGDFSATGVTIINPKTGQPFQNGIIPKDMINPVSQKALDLFFPNPTNSSAVLTSPNLQQLFPGSYSDNGFDGRLDHAFGPNHQPFGRGQKFAGSVSRAANMIVGGWSVTGVTLLQTGNWLTPFFSSSTADPSGTNPSQRSVGQQRPDCIGTGSLSSPTTSKYFDSAAFAIPASNIGRYGTCGTGILEGPGTATFSLSAGKTFRVTERLGFRYEAQFANLFNILNKDNPNMNVGGSAFGSITQSQQNQQAGPRTIQMMLRVQF